MTGIEAKSFTTIALALALCLVFVPSAPSATLSTETDTHHETPGSNEATAHISLNEDATPTLHLEGEHHLGDETGLTYNATHEKATLQGGANDETWELTIYPANTTLHTTASDYNLLGPDDDDDDRGGNHCRPSCL